MECRFVSVKTVYCLSLLCLTFLVDFTECCVMLELLRRIVVCVRLFLVLAHPGYPGLKGRKMVVVVNGVLCNSFAAIMYIYCKSVVRLTACFRCWSCTIFLFCVFQLQDLICEILQGQLVMFDKDSFHSILSMMPFSIFVLVIFSINKAQFHDAANNTVSSVIRMKVFLKWIFRKLGAFGKFVAMTGP